MYDRGNDEFCFHADIQWYANIEAECLDSAKALRNTNHQPHPNHVSAAPEQASQHHTICIQSPGPLLSCSSKLVMLEGSWVGFSYKRLILPVGS